MSNLKQTLIKRGMGGCACPNQPRGWLYHVMRWSWGFFPLFILSAVPMILPHITDDGVYIASWKVLILALAEGIAVALIASFTFGLGRGPGVWASWRSSWACRLIRFLYFPLNCIAVIFISLWWCNSVAYPPFSRLNPIPLYPYYETEDQEFYGSGRTWNVHVNGKSVQQVADWYVVASQQAKGRLTWRLAERKLSQLEGARFDVLLDGAYYSSILISVEAPGVTQIVVPAD